MLPGFEEHTADLNEYELTVLMPIFIKGFHDRLGVEKAITNKQIVEKMKAKNYSISDTRVRKVINHIRSTDAIPGLVASSKGYYVTEDPLEVERYIESLDGRETEIRRIKNTMRTYLHRLKNKHQVKLKFG